MNSYTYVPYTPLDVLKSFAAQISIVDGNEVEFIFFGLKLPFPTRMTVVRLTNGEIWVHSPVSCSAALASAIETLGPVGHLFAPNTLHLSYMPQWQVRFPDARCYGPLGVSRKASRRVRLDEQLGVNPPKSWGETFHQCLVSGSLMTEVDFFHRPSRTLIVTDLIENFELTRVRRPMLRWLMKSFGAADPDGKAPFDMQLSFPSHRAQVRAAARQMIDWAPERIVVAHGRCYTSNAIGELRRAFRWVV